MNKKESDRLLELLDILEEAKEESLTGHQLLIKAITEEAEAKRAKEHREVSKFANKAWEDMTPLERGEAKTKLHKHKQAEARAQIAKGMAEVMEKRNAKARNYNNEVIE